MNRKRRNSPWIWIPALFATEAIASAMVTYVALLMFVQLGASFAKAALMAALLMLPSVLKLFLGWKQKFNPYLKSMLIGVNLLLFAAFCLTAFVVDYVFSNIFVVFSATFLLALINAVNEKYIAVYYNNVLDKRAQSLLENYKFVATQVAFILTYGILIIFVGFHEIFFRNIHLAWSMEFFIVAGVILILLPFIVLTMQRPKRKSEVHDVHVYSRMNNAKIRSRNIRFLLIVCILLLPQSLLLYTRVFYLMTPASKGGLDCTLQEVGFAQGTIGVIAFMAGTFIGQHLLRRFGNIKMFWTMILPLLISPLFYLMMVLNGRPSDFLYICLMTFASQICFGFGLNICVIFIKRTTDIFDENILSLVHVPLVVMAMFVPAALSGYLLEIMQFKNFFILNVTVSLLSVCLILMNKRFIQRHILNYRKIRLNTA